MRRLLVVVVMLFATFGMGTRAQLGSAMAAAPYSEAKDFNSITNQGKVTGMTYSKLGENERL